ncbi:MAG TPA: helix-turn-helix transcriptional regulator [Kofleriaceae bacterium]|nr:helix-turn-helix transcriptional regulator [Kofleriaceae bacterium]
MARPVPVADHEVWARTAWAAVDVSRALGLAPDAVLAGLPYDDAALRRRKRVAWDDYCTIVEHIAAAAGGPRELDDLLAASYHQVAPELRALAGSLVSPRAFVHFVVDVLDPLWFPPVAFTFEDLGGDVVRIRNTLRPGARPCEAFFQGSTGAIRGVTAHLDLPLAEVLSAEIGPTHGVWELRLPASRTLVARARAAARRLVAQTVLGSEPDGTPIAATVGAGAGDLGEPRLAHATRVWRLTPRQAEVLALVVAGLANKEIASRLACADNTVELHVTRLLRSASVSSRSQLIARFWSEPTWGFPP